MCAYFFTDYTKTNTFFLGTSTDVTLQMTALHEQTDWPCATSTVEVRELQHSETQPSETRSDVARKQSKYWNLRVYSTACDRTFLDFMQLEIFILDSVSSCHLKSSLTC